LYQIAVGLKQLHNKGLLHRDFHGGNIVCGSGYVLVTDLGLCQPVDKPTPSNTDAKTVEVYGVMPYVAPEVLHGKPYSKASDVYSFGMLMYEIATSRLPFSNEPHDIDLVNQICSGVRPKLPNNIPSFYTQLIQQCWDSNPSMRPSAEYIVQTIHKWSNEPASNIISEIQEADARRLTETTDEQAKLKIHPQAIYTSRLLPTTELPESPVSEFVIS
jgi:serine/threonine protein kinase